MTLLEREVCSPLSKLPLREWGLSLRRFQTTEGHQGQTEPTGGLLDAHAALFQVGHSPAQISGLLQASVSAQPRAAPQRYRTLAKWPVLMVAMAETLADPAAVTLFVNLKTSRPLPETLARLNLTQLARPHILFPLTFREK